MKSPGESIRHAKARGEWAELRFITRALELKFRVSKPWGDSAPYDLVTDHRGRFRRVQVKCTIFHRGNSYKCHLDSNGSPYSPRDIDFIAAYVIPTDSWYILPHQIHQRTIRHPPNPAQHPRKIRKVQGSLVPAETLTRLLKR